MSTDVVDYLALVAVVLLVVTMERVHDLRARRAELVSLAPKEITDAHIRMNLRMTREVDTALHAHRVFAAVVAITLLHLVVTDTGAVISLLVVQAVLLLWLAIYWATHRVRVAVSLRRRPATRQS